MHKFNFTFWSRGAWERGYSITYVGKTNKQTNKQTNNKRKTKKEKVCSNLSHEWCRCLSKPGLPTIQMSLKPFLSMRWSSVPTFVRQSKSCCLGRLLFRFGPPVPLLCLLGTMGRLFYHKQQILFRFTNVGTPPHQQKVLQAHPEGRKVWCVYTVVIIICFWCFATWGAYNSNIRQVWTVKISFFCMSAAQKRRLCSSTIHITQKYWASSSSKGTLLDCNS